ncbi:type II secretion system F family protein [uncultured Brevibacterium sp.]|uniref:type II secretion system F family protein n=1 Tax=uncultured Brevibacterium sp. TaxID=189678 RepID=UPI0025D03BC0|nr:type II secretion system F family protein [uncultured Brevibacterium sp.]
MMLLGILLGTLVVLVLGSIGLVVFALGTGQQYDIVRAERSIGTVSFRTARIFPADRIFRKTRFGNKLSQQLTQANLRSITALEYLLIALAVSVVVFILLNRFIAVLYAVLLSALLLFGFWKILDVLKERQREKFAQQLPEFARIMANSTGAGLSIHTALGVAASELPEPASREFSALKRELEIGTPLDIALERMSNRIAGRDLNVLVSTLVIAQRSGGSLISSLRNMSDTLEFRKETKREVKTLVSQSSYTGYLVVAFGVGFVLLLSNFNDGLLYKLTSTIIGQVAIVIATICYAIGLVAISRLVKVKL